MKTFLQYVAKDILAKHGADGLADIAVVFPNKRASLFLNNALFTEAGKPVWSPSYYTISDLFRRHSELKVPDQIELVFRLYSEYIKLTGSEESLDHFFSWGQLLLSDFDDLDKNLVEADKLFINLEAWQDMRDFSFLSDEQRKSLEEFFGKVETDTVLQKRFNDIWKNLGKLYHAFRDSLRKDGLAYEGMLYRDVTEKKDVDFKYKQYIFVGFNLLQKVEQRLFRKLKEQGRAAFYWDYDAYYMTSQHEAGRYIRKYLEKFPNELSSDRVSAGIDSDDIYNNMAKPKDITYISAQTEDVQARYVSTWLNSIDKKSSRVAVVLCDERLLQNVIHCLPKDVGNVNITTGYPLSATPVATLVYALLNLRFYGKNKSGSNYKLASVSQVLRHPYARFISDDCKTLFEELSEHKNYYPTPDQLTEGRDENISLLFGTGSAKDERKASLQSVLEWIADILKIVGINSREEKEPLMHESVFRMYTLINRLKEIFATAEKDIFATPLAEASSGTTLLMRLLPQLIDSTSIPFHGEPALGIQIMGVLETRNLDFDHVLVLSCNEGNMPKGVNDASFIPHSLRKGYEMTTVENKIAIYSYYFHSLIQRAEDVTLTYNSATDDGRQGEMSRFMLQYMVEKDEKQPIKLISLMAGQNVSPVNRVPIEKTGEVKQKLEAIDSLSPTAINRYLRCNLMFYYASVCGLYEQDNDDEDEIDNATFGDIFHRTAELIYGYLSGEHHVKTVTREAIDNLVKEGHVIDDFLDQAFREKLFKTDNPSFRPRYNGLQLLNRNVLRQYILRLLRLDEASAPFDILALEENFYDKLTFDVKDSQRTISVGGQIDRLDRQTGRQGHTVSGDFLRVVDYKTGRPLTSSAPSIEEIFNPDYVDSKHTVYYLQAFLYAAIIRRSRHAQAAVNKADRPVAPALLFIRQASSSDYNPILKVKDKSEEGKKRASYSLVTDINNVYDEYIDGLKALLGEIFDEDIPFKPTDHKERCANCPYKDICGLSIEH